MKKYYISLVLLVSTFSLFSQRGKDGIGNITVANTIVNIYTPLTTSIGIGASIIPVTSTVGLAVGDLVMIIQMQGASVKAGKAYFIDTSMSLPADTSMGYILNYNAAGDHEFGQINAILSGTSFSLDCGVTHSYSTVGKTQIVRVPRYTTLTVSGAGYITCPPWNGSIGGVLAVESLSNTTISSAPSFSVNAKGFRGGGVENASTISGANKFGSVKPLEGGYKGESIAGDTNAYKAMAAVFCRGALANGGGGGTAHNAGGGGGANGGVVLNYLAYGNPVAGFNAAWNLESPGFSTVTSSGGGRGGYSFSSNNQNPNSFGPGSGGWSGDGRRNMGGFGGRPLDYSGGKIFVGGGGGSGDSNDNQGAPAGNGGGLVYILCYGDLTGVGTIVADGGAGTPPSNAGSCNGKEGASGGGGGGTVILNVVGITNLTAATAIFARGGNGANQTFGGPCFNSEAYGPGAGGGGGYIGTTGTLPVTSLTGGNNGVVSGNAGLIATNFPPNGATRGGAGSTGTLTAARTITATPSTTICVNNSVSLAAGTNTSGVTINWFSTAAGGSPIGTGAAFTTSVFTVPGTYTLYAGYCDRGTYRVPSIINVITGPTLTVNSPSICAGQTATLNGSGATTYTWNTGPTTGTITVTPTITTTYTIAGTVATCSSNLTTTVTVAAAPSITATPVTICNGQTVVLTASGATTYTWNTGPTTATIAVSPTTTTNYTVTGSNGSCSSVQATTVNVNTLPTVTATSGTICAGQTVTLTAGGASTYTWNTGPTTATIALSPTTTTNYTVTGNNGTCSNTQTTSITVNTLPSVTASSGTICPGQQVILTAGGATTYTWNTGPTTVTIAVTPTTTTIYTVTGSNGSCSNTFTTQVNVNPNPTITVNSPTLCSGQTTTLIAGGASTYTWNPGLLSGGSVTVSPGTTQIYTVTGTSALSCQGTNTTTVNVIPTPTLNVPSATICPGNTATLTASGATSYTWNPGGSTGTTFTATPPATTVYTVTGANGACTTTQTVSINIGSAISISVNNPSICSGQTATLTASGATTYTWSTSSNSNSITVSPTSTTVYTISGTSTSCNGVNTATVTVNTTPTVSTGTLSGICSGQTATLTASGASTYTWNPGGLSGSSVTVSPVSNQTYTVLGTSVAGCTNTASALLNVTTTPTVSAISATICTGGTATLTASGATSYTWNPGNITGTTFTANPASTTNYTVTGANGICISNTTVGISVGSALSVIINSPTICAGQSVTLTATSSATSYTWNTGANTNTVVVTPTTTTSYTVNASDAVCNGSGTTTVLVNVLPSVSVSGSAICSGQTVTLTASGATNYTWMPSGTNGTTYTDTPTTNTTYSVTGETSGCGNTATFNVTVTPTPSLTVTSPTICGGSTTLTATGATNYTWSPGGQTTSSVVVSPTVTTSYTINGANGSCLSSAIATVNVSSAPPLIINISNPSPFCPGTCSTFSTTTGYNGIVFDYGDATGTTTNTTHCYTASGNFTVTASGTFTSGCSLTTSTVVTISFLPVNTVTFDILGSAPYQVNSAVSFTSYGLSGNWSFGDGTSLTNAPDPIHTFNSGGTYCIKMVSPTTTLSCTDSLTKCIDIIQPVSINIPNVFTPNGDGKNDVFKVDGTGVIDFHCVILDRWGLRMYEWDGIGGSWDGFTRSGTQASAGTYFYIISYRTSDGKGEVVKGPLSLFK